MTELLENRLKRLEDVKLVLISGITNLFPAYEKHTFEDLLRSISGIKAILSKNNPLIVITAQLHESSQFRPKGGKILSHFGNVLVMIKDDERFTEYTLIQHPFLSENQLKKWKPREPKRNLGNQSKNSTLDMWMK
jgi:uncharacterized protein YvpB